MKKKIFIVIAIVSFFLLAAVCVGGYIYYVDGIKPAEKNNTEVETFVVEEGQTTKDVIDSLADAGFIKSKYAGYVFIKLHNDYVVQKGVYELNKGMSLEDILSKMNEGNVKDDSITVTFVEGKRVTYFVKVINQEFGYSEEEIYAVMSDKEYLQSLIDKYWFLTDEILNDKLYYALEGYLYPSTYFFKKDASIKEIIEKLLDTTDYELKNYKKEIEDSEYSVHEFLTLASIVELEGGNSNDRKGVAGVFYNRLNSGWSLGSDVTTYYGARVDMADRDLYINEINEVNDYNTRVPEMAGKLPVGPICNPSKESIEATIEPKEHSYFYFVADKNGKTYFTMTQAEHESKIAELKKNGLWFEY